MPVATPAPLLHVGDVKSRIILAVIENDAPVNLSSGFPVKQIILQSPGGPVTAYDASFVTDGVDGQVFIDTTDATLDAAGAWHAQVYLEATGGGKWHTSSVDFDVATSLVPAPTP